MANDECQELKNLKYKTMLLGGNKKTLSSVINDVSNLDILLDEESEQNKKESWNKLDKSIKMAKFNEYIKTLVPKHKLTVAEVKVLREYLSTNLDKKNLYKNKDVVYIKEHGKLENIPTLQFNNAKRTFTLKKAQHQSTVKALGPTKKNKTNKTGSKSPRAKSPKTKMSLEKDK